MKLFESNIKTNEMPSGDIINIHTTTSSQNIGYPRASSLYKACMRMHALGTKYKLKTNQVVGFSRNLTFDIGSSMHSFIQNDDKYFGDARRGIWECLACGKERPFGKPPLECHSCKSTALLYKEFELVMHEPYCVTGHPDMFIEPEESPGSIRVVELKTINGDKFLELQAPLIEHVWQIQTYMWACHKESFSLSTRIDENFGYIVYISKKETRNELPIKVFVTERDERILNEIKTKLSEYKHFKEEGVIPAVDASCVDSKFSSYKSRTCPASKICQRLDINGEL